MGDSCSIIAASGKGITTNAPFCGDLTIPQMWLEEQEALWMQPTESPKLIVIMVGGNDFYYNDPPQNDTFVETYVKFIQNIRKFKGDDIPIYLCQCTASCCSSEGSPTKHPMDDESAVRACALLNDLTRSVAEAFPDHRTRFFSIKAVLSTADHYGIMMHWNQLGHKSIANFIYESIVSN